MSGKRDDDLEVDAQGRAFFTAAGIRAEVVTTEEAAQATFVICGPVSYFPDDVHTLCAYCGAGIVHRPYIPAGPTKICMACMVKTTQGQG